MDEESVVKMEEDSVNSFPDPVSEEGAFEDATFEIDCFDAVTVKEEKEEENTSYEISRFPFSAIKQEKEEVDVCEVSRDYTVLQVVDDMSENRFVEGIAEISSSRFKNEPFRLSIVDDDGNILETYFEEGGELKPNVNSSNDHKSKIRNNNSHKRRDLAMKKKKFCKIKSGSSKYKERSRKDRHIDKVLKNNMYNCSLCTYDVKGRRSFKKHLKQHIKVKNNRYFCCFCHYSVGFIGHLNRHILRAHSPFQNSSDERVFTCDFCEKKFFEKKELKRHMFVHTKIGNLKCRFCEFSHIRKSSLENHMRLCHLVPGTPPSQRASQTEICECDYCGYKCRGKRSIIPHIQQHLDIYRYKCDECGYTSLFSGDLKKHCTIHSTERPFVCDICSKTFKRKSHLSSHKESHLSKSFICDLCSKAFKTKTQLLIHMKSKKSCTDKVNQIRKTNSNKRKKQ